MKLLTILTFGASAILTVSVPSAPARAHGGGLNAEGCHKNRTTGDYHCHRGAGSALSSAPSRSLKALGSYSGGAFSNCAAARAAGAAPVRRGEPGYGSHLDRDDDGVGCE